MSMFYSSQTEDDFSKARNKALVNEISHFLNPEKASMVSFKDVKSLLKPKTECYAGMQTIPIDRIVGSEGRYKDFDNRFLPKHSFLKNRWEHVDEAVYQSIVLPPIKVYELGGLYFVRDGNHRVSVAKARGVEFIDAEVVSLRSEIQLKPTNTLYGMIKQIIAYEKRDFYAETNFGDITDCWTLDFTSAGQYEVISDHILTHKYYINQNLVTEISMEDAIKSWYQTVYTPVVQSIRKNRLQPFFPQNTVSDLYVQIIKYWDELKKLFRNDFQLDDAVRIFKEQYKKSLYERFIIFLRGKKRVINIQKNADN